MMQPVFGVSVIYPAIIIRRYRLPKFGRNKSYHQVSRVVNPSIGHRFCQPNYVSSPEFLTGEQSYVQISLLLKKNTVYTSCEMILCIKSWLFPLRVSLHIQVRSIKTETGNRLSKIITFDTIVLYSKWWSL